MTTLIESSSQTLDTRAQRLVDLLQKDGIQVTFEEARQLILADAVERLKVKVP